MNGTQMQDRIYRGYGITAAKIGQNYDLYRSASPLDPLDIENKIGTLPLAFSARTRPFQVPLQYKEAVWLLWADGRELQPRDLLVGPYGTFYVADMQPNLPIQCVRCNDVATVIKRPGYDTSGAIIPDEETIATNVPMFKQLSRVDIKQQQNAANTSGVAITHWTTFIPMAEHALKKQDIILDSESIEYVLDAPDFTNMGYVTNIRLAQP